MKEHIKNLIVRLGNYNQKLDKIASFADRKWVFIDEASKKHSYIFKRDGKLIMSISGKVTEGAWEYLSEAESILIDRVQDKILLNHAFFDEALMILKYDGSPTEDLFILADEKKIPDLNIINYLNSKVGATKLKVAKTSAKKKIHIRQKSEEVLTIFTNYKEYDDDITGFNVGDTGFIKDRMPQDGLHVSKDGKYNITFNNGSITDYFVAHKYKLSDGTRLIVKSRQFNLPRKGDPAVYENGDPAKSGKFKIGFMNYVTIDNGRINKFSYW